MDNGGEGVFTSGCAGGGGVVYIIPVKKVQQNKKFGFKLAIRGLTGGHSGADIHLGRGAEALNDAYMFRNKHI